MIETKITGSWEGLKQEVVYTNPSIDELRNLVATGHVPPSIDVCTPDGNCDVFVAVFAAATNCRAPQEGEPDGTCPGCIDAFSGGGLEVIQVEGRVSPSQLDRLRGSLRAEPFVRWQIVSVAMDDIRRGRTSAALDAMLEHVPPRTTFVQRYAMDLDA